MPDSTTDRAKTERATTGREPRSEPGPVRLGFFTQPVHPATRDYRDVLREDREAITLADQLGYCEAFVGEHMTDVVEPITSCLAFIASLADRCPSITFGSAVLNLTSYHPVMVAAQVAMIDNLLDGRFLLGIGPGVPWDAEAFGNLDLDRNRKMLEAIDHVLAIWSTAPPYDLEGDHYRFTTERTLFPEVGAGIVVKPLQRPHPPIVVTAVRPHSEGLAAASARGWSAISSNYVQAHWVATHLPKYLEGRRKAGLSEDSGGWRVARSIFVADDDAVARTYAKSEDGPYGFYFRNMMTKLARMGGLYLFKEDPELPDSAVSVARSLETQVIAGSVDHVVDELLAFRQQVGDFGTLLYTGHDWADPSLARRSMELMAAEVMPRVNRALGLPL